MCNKGRQYTDNSVFLHVTGICRKKSTYNSPNEIKKQSTDISSDSNIKNEKYKVVMVAESRQLSSELLYCVVWQKFTDISEVLAASIRRKHL
jgi:hypothetical protein